MTLLSPRLLDSALHDRGKTWIEEQFVKSLLGAGIVAPRVHAQSAPDWGGPVLDTHLHLRKDADACFVHMQGCGVTNAILLTARPIRTGRNRKWNIARVASRGR